MVKVTKLQTDIQTDRQTDRQTVSQSDRQTEKQTLDLLPVCTIIIREIIKFKKTFTNSISHFWEKYKYAKK